ncbi:MAG: riboflavin synthase [Solirubrobacterales bacterium]
MFTGIVAAAGEVEAVESGAEGARLRIRTGLASELAAGDSISVSGVCLTAARVEDGAFEADAMLQTLKLTTLGELEAGSTVNLELALLPTDRMGGHVVQGHVDGTGAVASVEPDGFSRRLRVELPSELLDFAVERGSIAIDGVSLTVAAIAPDRGDWFEVSLIPETLKRTTLGGLEPGDKVNVECDVLTRYVERMLPTVSPSPKGATG